MGEKTVRWARVAVTLAALAMMSPGTAVAVDMVPGDYVYLATGPAPASVDEPALVFAFTPRSRVWLTLGSDRALRRSTDRLALAASRSAAPDGGEGPRHGLVVGGAFATGGIVVGAFYARPEVGGVPGDLVGAGLRMGPLVARLGVVHPDPAAGEAGDILLFGTELAATPWLALESDFALGLGEADGSVAAGRIGIRVDF